MSVRIVFWVVVLLLAYLYIGYPALIGVWALLRRGRLRTQRRAPTVSVLVVAHNEAAQIDARIENLLSLDYPRDQLEIIVASDGSSDDTVERSRAHVEAGIRVVTFERRRGKPAVLNDLIPNARGEIVVLADARQRFEAGALRALVEPFSDPRVGAVSGELILAEPLGGSGGTQGMGLYWRYEKFIRRSESRVDSAVGATGAIYAIRQALFDPIPVDTILDDVLIPLRIIRRGYRVLFEPQARAYDHVATSAREELMRKVRTLAGNFQLFARERWLLSPFQNRLWLQTLSHKGLRLAAPPLQAIVLATNVLLAAEPMYRGLLAAQMVFYAAALGGYAVQHAKRRSPLLTLPYTICLLSWATMVGFYRFVTRQQHVTWEKPVSSAHGDHSDTNLVASRLKHS